MKDNSYGFFSIEAGVINETSKAQLKDHGFLILFALEFDVLGSKPGGMIGKKSMVVFNAKRKETREEQKLMLCALL